MAAAFLCRTVSQYSPGCSLRTMRAFVPWPRSSPSAVSVCWCLVSADGRYVVNRKPVEGRSVELLAAELNAVSEGAKDLVVIVSADATAAHQSVVNVMDAARRAGLARLTFATQSSGGGER